MEKSAQQIYDLLLFSAALHELWLSAHTDFWSFEPDLDQISRAVPIRTIFIRFHPLPLLSARRLSRLDLVHSSQPSCCSSSSYPTESTSNESSSLSTDQVLGVAEDPATPKSILLLSARRLSRLTLSVGQSCPYFSSRPPLPEVDPSSTSLSNSSSWRLLERI